MSVKRPAGKYLLHGWVLAGALFAVHAIDAAGMAYARIPPINHGRCTSNIVARAHQRKGIPPLLKKTHRIVFLGNSITYSGQYIIDIEAYFIMHYPKRHFEFINVGLPSETVSGLSEPGHAGGKFPRPDLHERLKRVLARTRPDLVFASYGMNDGIYIPFDKERFQKFREGIEWLHDAVVRSGAKIIHLTPPVYDELRGKSIGYADVLDRYAGWLLHQQDSLKWQVADIHFPMKKYLEDHRRLDSAFAFASDGVHPNDLGHWIMARQVLLYLGEKEVDGMEDITPALAANVHGEEIVKLVTERQGMMKDAWLTATGHKRPGMRTGLPLAEAQARARETERQIRSLLSTTQKQAIVYPKEIRPDNNGNHIQAHGGGINAGKHIFVHKN